MVSGTASVVGLSRSGRHVFWKWLSPASILLIESLRYVGICLPFPHRSFQEVFNVGAF